MEQCVMITGTMKMPLLSVHNLDSLVMVSMILWCIASSSTHILLLMFESTLPSTDNHELILSVYVQVLLFYPLDHSVEHCLLF